MEFSENYFKNTKKELKELYIKTYEEELLERGKIKEKKPFKGGINKKFFITFENSNLTAIFKPGSGEYYCPIKGTLFCEKNRYKKERLSFVIDKVIGLDLIPETIIREIDNEEGALQLFIPDAKIVNTLFDAWEKLNKLSLVKLVFLDYIIFNWDRTGNNLLIKDNKIYAVDHELTFKKRLLSFQERNSDWLKSDIALDDTPILKEIGERIEKIFSDEGKEKNLRNLLAQHLSSEESNACLSRINKVWKFIKNRKIILSQMTYE